MIAETHSFNLSSFHHQQQLLKQPSIWNHNAVLGEMNLVLLLTKGMVI